MDKYNLISEKILAHIRRQHDQGLLTRLEAASALHENHKLLFEYSQFLESTNLNNILIWKEGVIIETSNGLKFLVDPEDPRSNALEVLNFGSLEGVDEQMFLEILRTAETFIDVGANVGWYSIHACHVGEGNIKVHAFEPLRQNLRNLERNIELNGYGSGINVYPFALGDMEIEGQLYWNPAETGATSFFNIREMDNPRRESVKIMRLDSLDIEIAGPLVVKIDVEGFEYFVLKGMEGVLKTHRPIVFCEILRKWSRKAGIDINAVLFYMRELGYYAARSNPSSSGFERVDEIDESTLNTNFFFFPR